MAYTKAMYTLFVALLLLCSSPLLAVDVVNADLKVDLGDKLEYLETTSPSANISEALTADSAWRRPEKNPPNFGFRSEAFWFRAAIVNSSHSDTIHYFLSIEYPLLDLLEVFVVRQNEVKKHEVLGDLLPFHQRTLQHSDFVVEVDFPPQEKTWLYFYVKTQSAVILPATLWDRESFYQYRLEANLIYGIFFGALLIMLIYNSFIFLTVRDNSYITYVFYGMSFVFFQACLSGFGYQYLWPNSPKLNSISIPVSILMCDLSLTLFTIYFLGLKTRLVKCYKFFVVCIFVCVAFIVFSVFGSYQVSIKLAILMTLLSATSCYVVGCLMWHKGLRHARFYVVGWTAFFIGTVVICLVYLGLIEYSLLLEHSQNLGTIIEIMLFSFALADRINSLKDEALAAEQSANKLKDQFMSTITHELLTPVNGVRLSLDLLKPKLNSEEDSQLYKSASESTTHLLSLIQSMFAFVETRRGKLNLELGVTELRPVFEKVFEHFDQIKLNGVELKFEWDDRLPVYSIIDGKKLTLILSQLLKNAHSFTEKGQITLRVEYPSDTECLVSVRDTGIGVGKEQVATLFDAFIQGDNTMRREHGGLGIGLTIVKDLLQLFGVTLSFVSELGVGTTASFRFPIEEPTSTQILQLKNRIDPKEKREFKRYQKILVVEDNPVNVRLICKVLEKSDYLPISAMNGVEALTILNQISDVEAILMDCQMPVMDGFEATRRIRQLDNYRKVPIIAVTANVSQADQKLCRQCGMDDYLAKPVRKETVTETLSYWLNRGDFRKLG